MLMAAAILAQLSACGGEGGAAGGGGGGPDTSDAEKYFLEQIRLEVGDVARFVSFREVSRTSEGEGDFGSCLVKFEGEVEFSADTHFYMKDRKKGERVKIDAEAEYVKEGSAWRRALAGIDAR
jgi:hypothetical protein